MSPRPASPDQPRRRICSAPDTSCITASASLNYAFAARSNADLEWTFLPLKMGDAIG